MTFPTAFDCGSITIRYEPVAGSDFVSTKPPLVPKFVAERSAVPSGFRIETFADEQHDVPIVTSVSLRLMRRPAVPLKTTAAFCPGTFTPTETGAPPGMTVASASGGTS